MEESFSMLVSSTTNEKKGNGSGELETLSQKGGEDVFYMGVHLIYTSTFRVYTVQSESEVLVKVVKVEHAVRMLH